MEFSITRKGSVLSLASNVVYILGVLLDPFMPSTSDEILRQLNVLEKKSLVKLTNKFHCYLQSGHAILKVRCSSVKYMYCFEI